jgi:4-amino-4-deoxy-L-arabinose transferase-like glycosyltransferase
MSQPAEVRARVFPWGPVLAIGAVVVILLLAVANRYGYHRDELYFLACGRRLAWGFVDQPPLTPALARLSDALLPGSLVGLRLWPALVVAGLVVLASLTARELGAGRVGQVGAAVCVACTPGILLAGHLLSTETFDLLAWAATTYIVVRLVRGADPRLWLVVGVVVGLGLENKWSIAFLIAGLLVGLVATPQRRVLITPWFPAGIVVALALWLPNLFWQADHGWAQLDMIRTIEGDSAGLGGTIAWLPFQVLITGFLPAIVWIAGLVHVLGSEEARPYRFLGIAYVLLAAVFAVFAGDKVYYAAGLYVPLYAAGALPLERWWSRHPRGIARPAAYAALATTTLLLLPVAIPVLPVTALANSPIIDLDPELGEQVGWPALVAEVARVWDGIPAGERPSAIVLTANYGEAGAVERFGPGFGLPVPYSGHNSYWWWGPPPADTRTAVLVGWSRPYAERFFGSVERVGTIRNAFGVDNEEQGAPIWLATDPRRPFPRMWTSFRHYD